MAVDAPWTQRGEGGLQPARRGGGGRGVAPRGCRRRPRKFYSLGRMPINADLKQLAEEEERDEPTAPLKRKQLDVRTNAGAYKTQLGRNISRAERNRGPATLEEVKWMQNWYEQVDKRRSIKKAWIMHLETQDWLVEQNFMDTRHYDAPPKKICNCPKCLPFLPPSTPWTRAWSDDSDDEKDGDFIDALVYRKAGVDAVKDKQPRQHVWPPSARE